MHIIFDPEHEDFNKHYALKVDKNEELVALVQYKIYSHHAYAISTFFAYHIGKFFLWRRDIGSKFFYYTRFLSFPILFGFLVYN